MSTKRNVYLIRHGQYHLNRRDEGELTERGIEQARTTAFALRNIRVNAIYASPIPRAKQTADIVSDMFPDVPLQINDDLRECIPEVSADFESVFAQRFPHVTKDRMQNCTAVLEKTFQQFFIPSDKDHTVNDIIVCHGNVIRFFVSRVLQMNTNSWINMVIHHCGISRVSIESDHRMFLISHNDIGHLADDLRTEN